MSRQGWRGQDRKEGMAEELGKNGKEGCRALGSGTTAREKGLQEPGPGAEG